MNTKRRISPKDYLLIIVGIIYLLTLVSSSPTLAQGNGPSIRKVRVLKTNQAGVQNPAGLAFSPEANAFYVVERRGPGQAPPAVTNIIKMTMSADRAGSTQIAAALKDSINVAYDSHFKRLLIFQTSSNRLLEVATDRNGELDPSKMIGHDLRYLNLQKPQGLAVDPDSGDIFILDSGGLQLIQIEPKADGGVDHTEVYIEDLSETDLVNPRGLAFDPTTGHLQVVNPGEQELYELTPTGRVVTTRNLVALDLRDPQGMVFAPSSVTTDDSATMNLYVADSGLDSGAQVQQVGSGEIVELSLSGAVSSTSQLSLNAATANSTLDVRVAASSDDAEERSSGHVSLTSTDLELTFDSGVQMTQIVGMRFNGLPIPQGSAITKAYVQFQVDEATSDTTDLNILGEASDNAATFVSSGGDVSSRPTTNASVAWSPVPWTTIGDAGPDQQTPDISPVIEEIVNRPGWASGNSVVVIITGSGKRVAESYDGTQAGAPLLHIEYSSTGNHNPVVLINTPANGATFNTGNAVSFSGTASDFEDGDLTASLVWTSDLDGQIGSGGSFSRSDLSVGVHTITATATDSQGLTGVNTVTLTVFADQPILVGAGDIANDGQHDEATATLLETLPGTVVTLGDNAYPNGTVDDFSNYYDPTWGRHIARTKPATGNHEYDTGTAAAYFDYFGAVAGDPSQGYYSFDKAGWHIIVLNSECSEVGGCGVTDPQGQWLQTDLAANPSACTLAIWHKPLFSSGFGSSAGQDFWTLLYQAEADVILNGHDHNYERFAPQDPNGVADPNGIREFVVGTGGAGHTAFNSPLAQNSVIRNNTDWGVLKLTLHPTSYDWEFIPIAGDTFTDSGSAICTTSSTNNAPIAADDSYTTDEDTPMNVAAPGVLGNDSDVDGDSLTAVLDTTPVNGTLTLSSDGSFSYTPDANFNGTDSFTYHANDSTTDSNVATVTITVNPVNQAPVAVDDAYATDEDTALNVAAPGVLGNDSDADGDTLNAVLDAGPTSGTLTLNPDGAFTYTPNANFNGSDMFTYVANDGIADSNIATVSITVNAVNDPPTAGDDAYATDENTPLNVAAPGVLTNDSDVDGDPLTAVLDTAPTNGSLTFNADGSFDYTPIANFNGNDSFTYHANDGALDSNTATVSITVNSANNNPPVAVDDSATTNEDTAVTIDVLANDSDVDGNALTVASVTQGSNGTVTSNGTDVTYTPNANFNGTDSFSYTISDGNGGADTANVFVTINPVNDAPTAVDDSYTTDEGTPLNVPAPGVLGNDSDVDGDPLTAVLDVGPSNGILTLNADGSLNYTPNAGFNGNDTFTYRANDGALDSNTATVTITVNPVNQAPVAADDSYATDQDTPLNVSAPGVLGNDSDPDGDPITAVLVSDVANGSLTLNADGSFIYTPNANFNGSDSFTYHANDGTADSNTAIVTITVNQVAGTSDALATSETAVAGTVSGDYTDTQADDGVAESITEQESGGKPSTRYSYLEHKWNFNVAPGSVVTLYANAWSSGSTDGDSFIFAYSTDDVNYIDMFTVDSTLDGAPQSYVLPASTQGAVYVRVIDSNRFSGNLNLDTVYVDHLYIRSETQLGSPPAAPSGLNATAISAGQIDLSWADNATDEDGFYIQRSEDGSNWSLIDTVGADVTAYSDLTVFPSTTYAYRVRAYNFSGPSDYSNTATATTPAGLNLTGTGYKTKGVQMVDLSWSGGSATSFDIYRDGNLLVSGVSGTAYTDNIGLKGGGTYEYQVCEAGSTINCSNIVQIIF
jgi:VCBS repeat-containing protein